MSTDLSILMSRRDSASQHRSGHDYSITTYVDAYNWRLNDHLMNCLLLLVRVRIYMHSNSMQCYNYEAGKPRRNENARNIYQLKGPRKEKRKTQCQLDRGKKEKVCLSQPEYRSPACTRIHIQSSRTGSRPFELRPRGDAAVADVGFVPAAPPTGCVQASRTASK